MMNPSCESLVSDALQTVEGWLDYISTVHVQPIDLGLQRILPIAETLGLRAFSCPTVVVAGTNGKGSVVRTLELLYLTAGYRVAAYTSPHLLCFNERLRINNQNCVDSVWVDAFAVIDRARGGTSLSFFEFTTLAALLICQQHALDIILLEVGLGGRLDAVNSVDADVAVVTNVDLDHTDWLGDTREAIGYEKAGIFRAGKSAVCGDPLPPACLVAHAAALDTTLYCYGRDYGYTVTGETWSWQSASCHYSQLPLPALKLQNVATALMVTQRLPLVLERDTVWATMPILSLAGRYERDTLSSGVRLIMDVAHNPQACQYLAERLQQERDSNNLGKIYGVVGMLRDKDIDRSLQALIPIVDDWSVVTLPIPRSATHAFLQETLQRHGKSSRGYACVRDALGEILSQAEARDIVLICGSFYTVEGAKRFFMTGGHHDERPI